MELTDAELLQRIAVKDTAAFNTLYKRYMRLFQSWAYSRTNNEEASKDIVQEFWIAIWDNPLYFKPDAKGSARKILMQFLTFRIINHMKSAAERHLGNEELLAEAENVLSYTHVIEELETTEIQALVENVLQTLPQIARDIFDLRVKKQYSNKEIASMLNVSEKTVRERYRWTLSIFKRKIADLYSDDNNRDIQTSLGQYLLLLTLLQLWS